LAFILAEWHLPVYSLWKKPISLKKGPDPIGFKKYRLGILRSIALGADSFSNGDGKRNKAPFGTGTLCKPLYKFFVDPGKGRNTLQRKLLWQA